MTVILILAVAVLSGTVVYAGRRIETITREHEEQQDIDHAKCMAHVAHYVGNGFAAEVLKAAATDYSSAEGQHQLQVIVQSRQWTEESDLKIPAVWMVNRANALLNEVKT